MTSSSINPNCCFCGSSYSDKVVKKWPIPSENDKIEFFKWSRYCRICNKNFGYLKYGQKCYICFSMKHDTAHCDNGHGFFSPSVDADLLRRFTAMLDGFENYFFAFSSIELLKAGELKHLIVAKNMELSEQKFYIPSFDDSNILITEKLEIFGLDLSSNVTKYIYYNFFTSIASKLLIMKVKYIVLHNIQISTDDFYLILSSKTMELKLFDLRFTPGIKYLIQI